MANTMTRIMKNTSRLSGVTLIELMVAVTISSVLLLGVGSVYYNSKRTYNVQQEFAQLQEGARFAVRFMVDDIRMAGFVGCAYNNDFNRAPKFVSFLNGAGTPENDTAIANFAERSCQTFLTRRRYLAPTSSLPDLRVIIRPASTETKLMPISVFLTLHFLLSTAIIATLPPVFVRDRYYLPQIAKRPDYSRPRPSYRVRILER